MWTSALTRTLCLLAVCMSCAFAEPRIPSVDSEILERLPAASATRELQPLRQALLENPKDLTGAIELSRRYIQIGRDTSDPRFVSYAEATLRPWMESASPPAAVLVL